MRRLLYEALVSWKNNPERKPLILEGVRQCGKTYLLKQFGAENYKKYVHLDFERMREIHSFFDRDLDPKRIIGELSAMYDIIIDKDTLIIFDEIQECARALTSLKYFADEASEYSIVCAGSLLGLSVHENASFPVGKVNFLTLRPMSFYEFLLANGKGGICSFADRLGPDDELPPAMADELRSQLLNYYVVGGMPEAVRAWVSKGSFSDIRKIHNEIINSYERDFSKYAIKDFAKLVLVWRSLPGQLAKENRKFFYGHVKTGGRAKELEDAVIWLVKAGLVNKVTEISKPGIPLSGYSDAGKFKLYLSDVGLLCTLMGVPPEAVIFGDPLFTEHRGAMTENYVLSELLVCGMTPYYWRSDGIAEVDFVIQMGSAIIPVEVKSGEKCKSKSLESYSKRYSPQLKTVVYMGGFHSLEALGIPLYTLWTFNGRVKSALESERRR